MGLFSFTSGPVHVPAHDLDEAVVNGDGAVVPPVRVKLSLVEAHVATLLCTCPRVQAVQSQRTEWHGMENEATTCSPMRARSGVLSPRRESIFAQNTGMGISLHTFGFAIILPYAIVRCSKMF